MESSLQDLAALLAACEGSRETFFDTFNPLYFRLEIEKILMSLLN